MAFPIVIGADAQPDTGFGVVIGTTDAVLLDFTVPSAPTGSVLAIVVVRDGALNCSDATWAKVIDGVGSSNQLVDVYTRTVDGTAGSVAGDVISFLSLTPQEMQGGILVIYNVLASTLVYDVQHAAFTTTTEPAVPTIDIAQANDTVLCIVSSSSAADVEGPTGFQEIDDYGSSTFETRSIVISTKRAGETGVFDPGSASATPASSGRAFTMGLRFTKVFFGHSSRAQPIDITNPSGHTRTT